MNLLLNILWFILGGWLIFLAYLLGGLILCITIIGIPFGIQCFKLSILGLAPFGREIRETDPPSGLLSVIMNVIWILLPGLELAVLHLVAGGDSPQAVADSGGGGGYVGYGMSRLLVSVSSDVDPGSVFLFDTKTGQAEPAVIMCPSCRA